MLTGKLIDLIKKDYRDEHLDKGLRFLKETNFTDLSTGVKKDSDEFFFVVNAYETKEIEDGFWEAHRKYLDIHYILEGTERIAFDHIANQSVIKEYDESKDVIILDGQVRSIVTLNQGDVMVCYPEDSHMTGIISKDKEMIRKIVVKVQIE